MLRLQRQNDQFEQGALGRLLNNGVADGMSIYAPQSGSSVDDRLQAYAYQSGNNMSYVADTAAFMRRKLAYDADDQAGKESRYNVGQSTDFGLHPMELAFTEADAQFALQNDSRETAGSLLFIQTSVFSVFNGLKRDDPNIQFRGVIVAGNDGEKPQIETGPLVSVRVAGDACIRNNGDNTIYAGDRLKPH
jgi:hypothetical protein